MKTVVLDTNFLVYAAKYKIDIERELERLFDVKFEIIVPSPVIIELKGLQRNAGLKDREAASVALEILNGFNIIKTSEKNADDACLLLAISASDGVLATMDLTLRKRFKKGRKGRFLVIRQKKYLALV